MPSGSPSALVRSCLEDGEVVAWDGPDLEMTAELIETQSGRGADR